MNNNKFNNYIIFWLSQSVSQLGSSMTGFALIIWAYKQTGSAMAVSLMTFFSFLPYIVVSIFAGTFIDSHKKKTILLWSDSIAVLCSVLIFILLMAKRLEIWHIYAANSIVGFMNAFQSPAQTVAMGMMVNEKDKRDEFIFNLTAYGCNTHAGCLYQLLLGFRGCNIY